MTQITPATRPWMRPATPGQAARYFASVLAGRALPLHVASAPAIRDALRGLAIYPRQDMSAPAQTYSVSLGRELLKLAADELSAADAAAVADLALALIAARRAKTDANCQLNS